MSAHLLRDLLEVLFVVAVGGMLWSVLRMLRAGQIHVFRCAGCQRPTSRAYPRCTHCGLSLSDSSGSSELYKT